ncbi:putative uncharacterized protein DDB_G0271606 [Drosophila grimshawi]|uniref:GH21851 n=1 Tax=Drosophila grimshawi TaxID=7222 RepID=B4J7N3_DROGR|nr:putative uncharacterized protein DDB_G0271606 [Drosophila grimshawi]EDW02181.1 GH21851 [Drosophila grimshawi]
MVRRRAAVLGGLTNQQSMTACQQLMPPSRLQLPLLPMYNKMAGSAAPRSPLEVNSARLQRLQRNLMKFPTQPNAVMLPMWCRSSGQQQQQQQQRSAIRAFENRQRKARSDIAIQLEQLHQIKRQQQQQQQLRMQHMQHKPQRQPQEKPKPKSFFMPFNFGKCASSLINFEVKARNATGSVAQPANQKQQQQIPTADFNYVQLAKQMCLEARQLANCGSNSSSQSQIAAQLALSTTEQELNCLAADIDSNLQNLHKILGTELPHCAAKLTQLTAPNLNRLQQSKHNILESLAAQHKATQLSSLAALQQSSSLAALQQSNSLAALQEYESAVNLELPQRAQAATATSNTSRRKSNSNKCQLNLNKLIEENKLRGTDSDPLWHSLMQLVAQMCESKKLSDDARLSAGSQKQYSVYLMVTSDEEDETECNPLPQLQQLRKPRRRRRTSSGWHRHIELPICQCLAAATRRPLHWPKQQAIKIPDQGQRRNRLPSRNSSRTRSRRSLGGNSWLTQQTAIVTNPKTGHYRHYLQQPLPNNRATELSFS